MKFFSIIIVLINICFIQHTIGRVTRPTEIDWIEAFDRCESKGDGLGTVVNDIVRFESGLTDESCETYLLAANTTRRYTMRIDDDNHSPLIVKYSYFPDEIDANNMNLIDHGTVELGPQDLIDAKVILKRKFNYKQRENQCNTKTGLSELRYSEASLELIHETRHIVCKTAIDSNTKLSYMSVHYYPSLNSGKLIDNL
ncbi:uncharacterized protein LOC128955587 isoform X2 [Oppia nitens]|uniref:uncharacterized protein LOC128955587 isoform X2 n=1 Tax=Oppia nitens TaxID=1686743 RepID=UPI0023DBFBFC|nr:uncharacterized protein LOC128955587 isoform X2 [Oppia nitens]